MTIDVSNNDPRIEYSVSQGSSQSVFSVPFEFFDNSDVKVYVDDVLKSEGAHYSLSGGDGSTGTLTFSSPVVGATGGSVVVLARHISLERVTDFVAGQDINRAALNEQLDTIVAQVADLDNKVDRTIHLSDSEVAPSMLLTSDRKGRVLAFNSTTGDVEAGPLSNDIATIADNIAEILDVNNQAAAAAASEAAAANSATAAQTAQTAAELAETNAETAETNAAASAVTAASEATTATTKASEASASAAAAAASEAGVDADRVAAQVAASAAATSETNAATSETNAATSETNAANSATSSASSATASANSATAASASENAASTSETNAAASAATATSEAATATTQASNAATSATAAATSATNAATSETNALSYVADSESARDQSQAARDTANLHKLAAEAAATSATNTAAALTGFDLEAIAETKGITAVDVFVYDTSKDSDGGAWRKRTQGTSWYNETLNTATRGSRKEFPAVAVIVAEATKVTIYDGDDPNLPMWMVFNGGTNTMPNLASSAIKSVSLLNGLLAVGCGPYDLHLIDFTKDGGSIRNAAGYANYKQTIAERNTIVAATYYTDATKAIVNRTVNDVAMTVLPDAPIDPATGLPVPTIAVATAGGVSVIKDDGTVVSKTLGFPQVGQVSFSQDLWLYFNAGAFSYAGAMWRAYVGDRPTALSQVSIGVTTGYGGSGIELGGNSGRQIAAQHLGDSNLSFFAGASGLASDWEKNRLNVFYDNKTSVFKSMLASVTSTYNTGWMNGDIKGAFLSDTDDTDLVGSGELVTNGTFDTDVSGWTNTNATIASVSSELQVSGQTASPSSTNQTLSGLVVGKTYAVTATYYQTGSGVNAARISFFGKTSANNGTSTPVTETIYVTATSTTASLSLQSYGTSSTVSHFDNVSVKLADADRSVNNNGLIVNGTVTRTPVATGADLVAYSGFSASNYLEQPYNSDLDFGTGDFCVMGWVKTTDTVAAIMMRSDGIAVDSYRLDLVSGLPRFRVRDSVNDKSASGASAINNGSWRFVVGTRLGGSLYLYVDGQLAATTTGSTADASFAGTVRVGVYQDGALPLTNGSLALLRISATAPSAEQIAKIYNDEKVLFQENAQATLYGSSDAVTALAHDDATDLLHVGTSAGRSVFQGLRRVSNTTTAVGTAISASNGLVVEE